MKKQGSPSLGLGKNDVRCISIYTTISLFDSTFSPLTFMIVNKIRTLLVFISSSKLVTFGTFFFFRVFNGFGCSYEVMNFSMIDSQIFLATSHDKTKPTFFTTSGTSEKFTYMIGFFRNSDSHLAGCTYCMKT